MSKGCKRQTNGYSDCLAEVFAAKEGNISADISVQTYEELQLHKLSPLYVTCAPLSEYTWTFMSSNKILYTLSIPRRNKRNCAFI